MEVRTAQLTEIDHLAKVWFDGWQDAHAEILPAALRRVRTRESFRDRLRAGLSSVRVVGPSGSPVGFCIVQGDELYQLYVSAEARGSGAARMLIDDGEARLRENGTRVAWLACAIGNERAARFYEKSGWHRAGIMESRLDTTEGTFCLDVWRYEKTLIPSG